MKFRAGRWIALALGLFLAVSSAAGAAGRGQDLAFGDWLTGNGKAVVRITPCEADLLCGEIVWLRNEQTSGERLFNQDGQALRGAQILIGFRRRGEGWSDGRIHAINTGKSYRSKLVALDARRLKVEGCVGPFCGKQIWTRVELSDAGPTPLPFPTLVATAP